MTTRTRPASRCRSTAPTRRTASSRPAVARPAAAAACGAASRATRDGQTLIGLLPSSRRRPWPRRPVTATTPAALAQRRGCSCSTTGCTRPAPRIVRAAGTRRTWLVAGVLGVVLGRAATPSRCSTRCRTPATSTCAEARAAGAGRGRARATSSSRAPHAAPARARSRSGAETQRAPPRRRAAGLNLRNLTGSIFSSKTRETRQVDKSFPPAQRTVRSHCRGLALGGALKVTKTNGGARRRRQALRSR